MKHPSAKDLPHFAAAFRADGLPDGPPSRWWATKILVIDGFRRGLSLVAVVSLVMAVLAKHPHRSKDFQANPAAVRRDTYSYARKFFEHMPSEASLCEVVSSIAGGDFWCAARDVCILVLQVCRLCSQSRGCQRADGSFVVPVAVALVQRWLPSGTKASASRLLGLAVRSGCLEIVAEAIPETKARTYRVDIPLKASEPFLGGVEELAAVVPPNLGDVLLVDADGKTTRALIAGAKEIVHLPRSMGLADPARKVILLDLERTAKSLSGDTTDLRKRWCHQEHGFRGEEGGLAVFVPPASVWRSPRKKKPKDNDPREQLKHLVALPPEDLAVVWFAECATWPLELRKELEQRVHEGLATALERGWLADTGKVIELTDAGRHQVDQIAASTIHQQKET